GFGINWGPWTYISGLKTVPGTPITAVQGPLYGFPHGYGISLFLTDHNGQVYTTSGYTTLGFGINWGPWTSVSQGSSVPGGRVTALVTSSVPGSQEITLFLADPNGGVYTNSGFGINWGPWTYISGLKTVPGTPITAVAYEDDHDQYVFHFVLLLADYKGEVYTNSDF